MKNIILITRENEKEVTGVTISLCNSDSEDVLTFCSYINNLSLKDCNKLVAREILMNREYPLAKYKPITFDNILSIDSRTIQKVMRELDSSILATALVDASEEVKNLFFRNMSNRSAYMLKEDMEYIGPVSKSDLEGARQVIMDIVNRLSLRASNASITMYEKIAKMKKTDKKKHFIAEKEENNIVLVFRGYGEIADYLSVSIFDTHTDADNFCNFLNELKPDKDGFIFARHAAQMVEYEITKPLLIRFNQILEYYRLYNESLGLRIIRETLKKFKSETLLAALKGLDKRSREIIMQSLPIKTVDDINEMIEYS